MCLCVMRMLTTRGASIEVIASVCSVMSMLHVFVCHQNVDYSLSVDVIASACSVMSMLHVFVCHENVEYSFCRRQRRSISLQGHEYVACVCVSWEC